MSDTAIEDTSYILTNYSDDKRELYAWSWSETKFAPTKTVHAAADLSDEVRDSILQHNVGVAHRFLHGPSGPAPAPNLPPVAAPKEPSPPAGPYVPHPYTPVLSGLALDLFEQSQQPQPPKPPADKGLSPPGPPQPPPEALEE